MKTYTNLKEALNEKYPNLKYRIVVENPPETIESVYMHHVLMGMKEDDIKISVSGSFEEFKSFKESVKYILSG